MLTAALALVAPLVMVGPAAGADSDSPQPAGPTEAAASFYGSPGPDRAAQTAASPAVKPAPRDALSRSRAPGTAQDSGAGRVLLSPTTTGGDDWCAQTAPGSPGTRGAAVDLSAAHATVREFSVAAPFGTSDSALADALDGADPLGTGLSAATSAYAEALDDVCRLPATAATLGPAQVQSSNRVARVSPGTGPVALPPDTEVVVVDLRDLPAVAGLRAALERAVAPALARPVPRPAQFVRGHHGPVDEVFSQFNVYSTSVTYHQQSPIPAAGRRDLPLVLLTGDTMAPEAAELAGALRMAGRAWIAGEDLVSAVGEADWRGVGGDGLAVRTALHDQLLGTARTSLRGQLARQDDPNDPTTSTYRRTITVPADARGLDITVDGLPGTDLDLFVLYDFDGNGSFDFPFELVAFSASPAVDEQARLLGDLPAGEYQIWVHGWYVPAGVTRFGLETAITTGQVWPDIVPADFDAALADSPAALSAAVTRRTPPPVTGPAARGGPQPVFPFGQQQPVTTGRGELRAGLIIVHGMTRLFFRYFPVVGDGIDGRLQETLGAADTWDGTDRRAAQRILRRFGEVLHDGHQFVFDLGPQTFAGFLPVFLEEVDGRPVIRRSAIDDLHPGDTILAMNGRTIEDIYAEEYARTSAATAGYRFDLASRQVSRLVGPTEVLLADPDGAERTVTVEPQPLEVLQEATLAGPSDRPSGPLTDLGAPGLYYLNLDTEYSTSMAEVRAALADATARQSSGLVLDMRGYPGGANHYEVAARLIRQPFLSPIFDNNAFQGPDTLTRSLRQYLLFPEPAPAWDGPIVLLTGPHAVSAAENFMQMLVGADRLVAVVGQRSAGTNGNITGVQLPGGFEFLYTGMEVRNVDGSTFHGVGITPDIEVPLTAADLRDGIDRDILTAIDVLTP